MAVILFFVAQKFKVIEDPRIDLVDDVLPKANCGGCGYPGCRNFAEVSVKSASEKQSLEGLNCPVGGNAVMKQVAAILQLEVAELDPQIAVVRCNGTPTHHPSRVSYEGASSCTFAHNLFGGEGGCHYSCLGLGDCVVSCDFDAIHMNPETGLPVVNDKCVACGACVKACPRNIIELRPRGKKDRRIFVSCMNKDKGGIAKKNCEVACTGCTKCFQVCPYDAITMADYLAYIDAEKCKLCRKCVDVCPTNSIHEINFPARKIKVETGDGSVAAEAAAARKAEKVIKEKPAAGENEKPSEPTA
ncbi:MAG TPA: RnfABCDGE type electron transport complex subunit B [Bacteroidales bacterium]|nr:RnfABCDGE type electron transport complex subunit B [Bacteroidales bacterium]